MNFLNNVLTILLASKNDDSTNKQAKKRLTKGLSRNYVYRVELTLDKLKSAIDSAKMPDNPDRELLYTIYAQAVMDSHLAAQMRTAVFRVVQSDFFIGTKGKPDEDKTELLRTKWFDDFISLAIDAEFWGHSLIEFGRLNDDGRFESVQLIPRLNVRQEMGLVVAQYSDDTGFTYRDKASSLGLIEIGTPYDLGVLELAAKEVIVKNYARTDWSQASEKYGMPLLKILTDSRDEKELDRMESQAASFGSNGYIIAAKDDDVDIVQAPKSDFYKIYQENINLCDAQLSKIINGQTGTSDEKAFVGSAEVHERILDNYTQSRLRRVQHIVNNQLLPFLAEWGYPISPEDRFIFKDLLVKPESETKRDSQDQNEKKKLSFPDWLIEPTMEA